MRVAYVCADPGIPVFGNKGASVHVQGVIRAMRARDARVELLAARVGGPAPTGLEDVAVHLLPGRVSGSSIEREVAASNAGADTTALDHLGPLDLVYERYSLWGRAAMAWARRAGIPGVLEVNAPLIDEHARHRTLHDHVAAHAASREALGAASTIIAVSPPVADWVRTVVPDAACHVVPNGVDTDRVRPRADPPGTAAATCTVGFVGTLKPWHGIDTLVDVFGLLTRADPAYRLLVVGDGPEGPDLVRRLAVAGIADRAELTGAVDPAAVPGLLARMEVAVAPYPATAGYFSPLKLYEYLAAGLPVVASRVGQVPDIVEDGVTGILCPPGDAAAMATAVDRLRHDPVRAAALGRAGRRAVVADHTWAAVVDRILAAADLPVPVPAVGV